MPVHKVPGGIYLPWYYDIEAKGRARKRAARPKRDILSIKRALEKLGLRYWQEVSFWNPFHTGRHGNLSGGLQWVDFVVRGERRPLVIILDDPNKRTKEYEKEYLRTKKAWLQARNIPVLILPANKTSQEYWIQIWVHMKKKKGE